MKRNGYEDHIIPNSWLNPYLQNGDPLSSPATEAPVDTLGVIMQSRDTYVALTAGHILENGDRTMIMRSRDGRPAAVLAVTNYSLRFNNRPIGRKDEPIGFQDECAFLKISPQETIKFNYIIPSLNPHHFNSKPPRANEIGDLLSVSRRTS